MLCNSVLIIHLKAAEQTNKNLKKMPFFFSFLKVNMFLLTINDHILTKGF